MRNYISNVQAKDSSSNGDTPCTTSLAPGDCEAEIAKWIRLILMSPFLETCHPDWVKSVLTLRETVPRPLVNTIHEKVSFG